MTSLLVVYAQMQHPLRSTVEDHLYSFRRHSRARVYYANAMLRPVPRWLAGAGHGGVIYHTSLLSMMRWGPLEMAETLLSRARAVRDAAPRRAMLPQDEFLKSDLLRRFADECQVNLICSVSPESEWERIYAGIDRDRVRIEKVLTGYLDGRTLRRIERIARHKDRPVDIGYRAGAPRPYLGRHGMLKTDIAHAAQAAAVALGLSMDISVQSKDALLGDDWFRAMAGWRWTLGVEGGASILDHDGALRERTDRYVSEHPDATYEEVEVACFPGRDGELDLLALSPRHLEACATRTGQLLVKGDYDGILKPERHYLPVRRDLSDLPDALARTRNEELRRAMTERAYQDVVGSGQYTYVRFVEQVETALRPGPSNASFASYLAARAYDDLSWLEVAWRVRVRSRAMRLVGRVFRLRPLRVVRGRRDAAEVAASLPGSMRALRTPTISGLRHHLARIRHVREPPSPEALEPHPSVRALERARETAVDRYWTGHTVRAERFRTPAASERNLEWRFDQYPLFREFSGLWGEHGGEVILDYGCGPGNDLTGFALYTGARKLVGIDVSATALERAAQRLALHGIAESRVELIRAGDAEAEIPLDDTSVDHVNCQGVLHHTSDPAAILKELARVLRPGGTGCVMVYNQRSVWFHLYTAYERMIVENAFPGLDIHQAFARNTDGPDCPISRSYPPEDFIAMCREAGFRTEFVGGYLSVRELQSLRDSFARAIADGRLADEHRSFLRELRLDVQGLPMHGSHHVGIGGTYRLLKSDG